jgi:Disulphide bond corrector protein DsbC
MLSDPESIMIRAFDIVNDNFPKDNPWYGIPFPGMYIIDEHGVVTAKYFEGDHRERFTAASILVHQFGQDGAVKTSVNAPHIQLTYSASDAALSPGGTATLILDIDLKPGMHVYAPGIEGGYIPIDWKMPESKAWIAEPVSYPQSKKLNLPAIHETVPVYQGHVRIIRDLTIGQPPEIEPFLGADRSLAVEGAFRYQACDEKECYPPQSIPLKWNFRIDKLDSQRAPVDLQRGASQK